MPAGAVEDQEDMIAWRQRLGELDQEHGHGFGRDGGQNEGEFVAGGYPFGQGRRVTRVKRLWPALPRQVCPSSTAIARGGVTPDDR